MNRYQVGQVIGDGTYGTVMVAFDKQNGEQVAIKKMKRSFYSFEACMELREVKALRTIDHPNVIRLRNFFRENDMLFLVFEHMACNLYDVIKDRDEAFPEQLVRSWFYQVLRGLAYVHKKGFFHRDLKPENLLIGGPHYETLKIADFGLAREIASSPPYTQYISTRWYRAPEVLLRGTYNAPTDLWAIGVIMAEVFTFKPLFPGNNDSDQLVRICNLLGTPSETNWSTGVQLAESMGFQLHRSNPRSLNEVLRGVNPLAVQLVADLLQYEPEKRPSAAAAMQHPYFTEALTVPRNPIRYVANQHIAPRPTSRKKPLNEFIFRGQEAVGERYHGQDAWQNQSFSHAAAMDSRYGGWDAAAVVSNGQISARQHVRNNDIPVGSDEHGPRIPGPQRSMNIRRGTMNPHHVIAAHVVPSEGSLAGPMLPQDAIPPQQRQPHPQDLQKQAPRHRPPILDASQAMVTDLHPPAVVNSDEAKYGHSMTPGQLNSLMTSPQQVHVPRAESPPDKPQMLFQNLDENHRQVRLYPGPRYPGHHAVEVLGNASSGKQQWRFPHPTQVVETRPSLSMQPFSIIGRDDGELRRSFLHRSQTVSYPVPSLQYAASPPAYTPSMPTYQMGPGQRPQDNNYVHYQQYQQQLPHQAQPYPHEPGSSAEQVLSDRWEAQMDKLRQNVMHHVVVRIDGLENSAAADPDVQRVIGNFPLIDPGFDDVQDVQDWSRHARDGVAVNNGIGGGNPWSR